MNTTPLPFIPFEIVAHIFCVAKYKRSLQFLRTCKYFSFNDAWQLKCKIQFPLKPYFGVWTHREYYMALYLKPTFTVAVNFSDAKEVSQYIYEYHPGLFDKLIHTGYGYGAFDFVKFKNGPKKPLVIIKKDWNDRCQILKFCSSVKSATGYIRKDKQKDENIRNDPNYTIITSDSEDDGLKSQYVIIDLKSTTPWFLTGPTVRRVPYNPKFYTFL